MMLSNVDLPHPDGPITATNSPGLTVKSTPRNARTGAPSDSNVLRSPRVKTTTPPAIRLLGHGVISSIVDAVGVHHSVPPFHHCSPRSTQSGATRSAA